MLLLLGANMSNTVLGLVKTWRKKLKDFFSVKRCVPNYLTPMSRNDQEKRGRKSLTEFYGPEQKKKFFLLRKKGYNFSMFTFFQPKRFYNISLFCLVQRIPSLFLGRFIKVEISVKTKGRQKERYTINLNVKNLFRSFGHFRPYHFRPFFIIRSSHPVFRFFLRNSFI